MKTETIKGQKMDFEVIREGTVFQHGDSYYLRANQGRAVDISTGSIYDDNDWGACYIYPRATLKLR